MKTDLLQFAHCQVLDETGSPVKMASLWQKQTALFIFLRHFACIACRAHAQQVWEKRAAYEAGGAKIYFIGNGHPNFISMFKEDLGIQGATIYTDPTLAAFKAAGFQRGFLKAVGPTAIRNGLQLKAKGYKQASYQKGMGDLWQLGGLLVIKKDGRVGYQYISEATGDFPLEEDIKKTPWTPHDGNASV